MTPELIEAIGTWIVLPICAAGAYCWMIWLVLKDDE